MSTISSLVDLWQAETEYKAASEASVRALPAPTNNDWWAHLDRCKAHREQTALATAPLIRRLLQGQDGTMADAYAESAARTRAAIRR